MDVSVLHSFSLCLGFIPLGFTCKVFNDAILPNFLKFHNDHLRESVIRKCVNDTQSTEGMLATFVK